MTDQDRERWRDFAKGMGELFERWKWQDMEQSVARKVAFRHRGRMPEPREVTEKEIEEELERNLRLSKLVREYIKEVVVHFPKDELRELHNEVERALPFFASVHWQPIDIQALRPEMDDNEAAQELDHMEGPLQDAMVERGWDVIKQLLPPVADPHA